MVAALGRCKDNRELEILKPREVASAGLDMVEKASFKAGSVYEITKKLGIRRAFSSTEKCKGTRGGIGADSFSIYIHTNIAERRATQSQVRLAIRHIFR
jgi:hypothetical protein